MFEVKWTCVVHTHSIKDTVRGGGWLIIFEDEVMLHLQVKHPQVMERMLLW